MFCLRDGRYLSFLPCGHSVSPSGEVLDACLTRGNVWPVMVGGALHPEAQNAMPKGNYTDGKNSAARDAEYAEIADRLFGPAPTAPETPAERAKGYEDAVTTRLN